DGRTLFGERLEALDPARFAALADRLGVAVVVALEDDVTQLGWLAESTAFRRRLSLAPFVVFTRESAVALPTPRDGVWRTTLAGEAGGWTCARVAYYPLWRADADGAPLPTRRGADGLLEVQLTRALQTVTLRYDRHHLPEAPALGAERRQFGRAAPERGRGRRLGARRLRREEAGAVAARAQDETPGLVHHRHRHRRAERLRLALRRLHGGFCHREREVDHGRLLTGVMGGPDMAPQTPQALGPPRRSRDGPRYPDRLLG